MVKKNLKYLSYPDDTIYNEINNKLKNKVFVKILGSQVHACMSTPSNKIIRVIDSILGEMEVIEYCIRAELVQTSIQ